MKGGRHPLAVLVAVLGLGASSAWLAGFVWFVHQAVLPSPAAPPADGIVALTGGADRVATAIAMLQHNRARVLLISGVGPNTPAQLLFRGTGIDPASVAGRITYGRNATDTLGNASEAAVWARANDVHSLIVVTAGYHMKRAITELGRALPDVTLYPQAVVPPALRRGTQFSTLRLLANEYTKWLAAELGLSRLQRVRDAG